jgi:hypothetical protein
MDRIGKQDRTAAADTRPVTDVLEAIDGLLDAMEGLEAPITRELLATAMMALVHECGLSRGERAVH